MTESARRVFPPNHEYAGYIQPPRKSDVEGGQVFANRCDSFLSIHRFINSPESWMMTQVRVEKIKDKETGGTPTLDSVMLLMMILLYMMNDILFFIAIL